MTKFLIAIAACVLYVEAGIVRRDAPSPLEQLQKNAEEFSKTFSAQFNSFVNSKNTQEFNKQLQESSDNILKQVSSFSTAIQGALADADGKAKEALQKASAELKKTEAELKKNHPEVQTRAEDLRKGIASAIESTLKNSQVLAKDVAANIEQTNDKLAPTIKKAYDDFVKQAQEVQKKLHEAATKQ